MLGCIQCEQRLDPGTIAGKHSNTSLLPVHRHDLVKNHRLTFNHTKPGSCYTPANQTFLGLNSCATPPHTCFVEWWSTLLEMRYSYREKSLRLPYPQRAKRRQRPVEEDPYRSYRSQKSPPIRNLSSCSSCLQQGYHHAPHGAHRTDTFQCIRLSSSTRLLGDDKLVDGLIHLKAHQSKHSTTCYMESSAMPENKTPLLLPSSAFLGLLVDSLFVWVSPGGPSPSLLLLLR